MVLELRKDQTISGESAMSDKRQRRRAMKRRLSKQQARYRTPVTFWTLVIMFVAALALFLGRAGGLF